MENYLKAQLDSNILTLLQEEDIPFTDGFYLSAILSAEEDKQRSVLWRKYQSAIQKSINPLQIVELGERSNAELLMQTAFENSKYNQVLADLEMNFNVHPVIARAAGLRHFCEHGEFPLNSKHPMMFFNIEIKEKDKVPDLISNFVERRYPDMSEDEHSDIFNKRIELYHTKWAELILNYKIKTNVNVLRQAVFHINIHNRIESLNAKEKAYLLYNVSQVYLQPQNRPRLDVAGPILYMNVFDFADKALGIQSDWFHQLKNTYNLLDWNIKNLMDLKVMYALYSATDQTPTEELTFEF